MKEGYSPQDERGHEDGGERQDYFEVEIQFVPKLSAIFSPVALI
jgi:hypothetical protein